MVDFLGPKKIFRGYNKLQNMKPESGTKSEGLAQEPGGVARGFVGVAFHSHQPGARRFRCCNPTKIKSLCDGRYIALGAKSRWGKPSNNTLHVGGWT